MMIRQKPRKQKLWTIDELIKLKSYHNQGLDFKEVGELMGVDAKRVKNKASHMGVVLAKQKTPS